MAWILSIVTAQPNYDQLPRPPTSNISSDINARVSLKGTVPIFADLSRQHPFFEELQRASGLPSDFVLYFQKIESETASSIVHVNNKLLSRLVCELGDNFQYPKDRTQSSNITDIIYSLHNTLGEIVLHNYRLQEFYGARITDCARLEKTYQQECHDLLFSFSTEAIWARSPLRWTGVGAKRRLQERLDRIYDKMMDVKSVKLLLTGANLLLVEQLKASQGFQSEVQKLPSRLEEEGVPVPSVHETWPKDWFWDHVAPYLVTENQIPLTQSRFDSWWDDLAHQCPRSQSQQIPTHEAFIVWFCSILVSLHRSIQTPPLRWLDDHLCQSLEWI